MQLVVGGADPAAGVDHEAAVDEAAMVFAQRERSELNPDAVARGSVSHGGEDRIVILRHDRRRAARTIAIEQARHFGGEQHRRALPRR